MLQLLADHHVKRPIVDGLRLHGIDVVTARERGWDLFDDEALLAAAANEGRVLLTNDKGFLRRDSQWRKGGRRHAGIVFWPQAKRSIGDAIRAIVVFASTTPPDGAEGRVEFI